MAKDGATAGQEDVDEGFESYLRAMAYTAQGALSPLSEFFGGFVAQEGLKARNEWGDDGWLDGSIVVPNFLL